MSKGKPGDDHPNAQVTEWTIRKMREARTRGTTCVELARTYGLHPDSVSRLTRGRGRVGDEADPRWNRKGAPAYRLPSVTDAT